MLSRGRGEAGFSLIELMVTVVVLALLLLAAVPSFGTWAADSRIRTTAESLQNGLRHAQAEAMQRNRRSAFVLTNDTPALGARPVENGSRWYSRVLLLADSDESDNPDKDAAAQGRFVQGDSFGSQPSVRIEGPAAVCFSPLGRLLELSTSDTGLGAECEAREWHYEVSSTVHGTRKLEVRVYPGGRVRMCDPAKELSSENPDGCEKE